jgi:acyl dehydratase
MQVVGSSKPFNGEDLRAVHLDCEQQAGAHGAPVKKHRAGAADSVLTAHVCACEAEALAERIVPANYETGLELLEGRFSSVVFPGETVTVDGWADGRFRVSTARGVAVSGGRSVFTAS